MLDFDVTQLNQTFIDALDDPSMRKEAAEQAAEYLKSQIYEDSFMVKILPPQGIRPEQCDRDVNSPNYQVVIDKEYADVQAVTTTFRGRSDFDFVETERYAVTFRELESREYSLTEGELRGMRQPVQNLIRHHIAYYLRKRMDEIFIGMCNAAVGASGLHLDLSAGSDDRITPDLVNQLTDLIDEQSPKYLEATTLLMTKPQYKKINTWIQHNTASGAGTLPGMTGGIGADFWRDGYKYPTLFGFRLIVTNKTDLINTNEIFAFTEPEYLGHHFTFNDDRFSIEQRHKQMSWKGYRTFGAAIGNINAVAKLTLKP